MPVACSACAAEWGHPSSLLIVRLPPASNTADAQVLQAGGSNCQLVIRSLAVAAAAAVAAEFGVLSALVHWSGRRNCCCCCCQLH
jgi:hypothetical protein